MSNFDPFEASKERGRIYGKGAAGKYKKKLVTRIGFILLGTPCLVFGAVFIYDFFSIFMKYEDLGMRFSGFIWAAMGIGLTSLGFFMIKNAVKK